MANYTKGEIVNDNEELIRWINPLFLREDETISPEAFRPRQQDLADGVSVDLKIAIGGDKIPKTNWVKKLKFSAGQILAKIPNSINYRVKFTGGHHCVINDDVKKLTTDEESLLILADNCEVIFNPEKDKDKIRE